MENVQHDMTYCYCYNISYKYWQKWQQGLSLATHGISQISILLCMVSSCELA